MHKRKRLILLAIIFVSLAAVGYKVAESIWVMKAREFRKDPLKALEHLPESALRIRDFRRAKIEDGRKVWELFGDEASYFKEQREAVIKKPRFFYYDKKGQTAETTGEVARIYLNEKDLEKMELQGGIQLAYQGYVLNSDEAVYLPAKQQIVFPRRTTMVGEGLELEGSSMEVELDDKKVRLLRNVKTKIEPNKLPKKRKEANLNLADRR
jgi:LPS export ABC transporter protein LptC